MIERRTHHILSEALRHQPAVVLVGPRQVGKTTLAYQFVDTEGAMYLDLESPSDRAKIQDVEAYCEMHKDKLLILDEIQRIPELFAPLRGVIDKRRREGRKTGHFLLLGSATLDLIQQTSESLAGRIAMMELPPFGVDELPDENGQHVWLRGGFPESFLAENDAQSMEWREQFIRTYLERDVPQLGPRIPAETLRRFWTMLAHHQATPFNAASLARGLDVKGITVSRYLDLMVDLLLVRRIPAWHSNIGKRMAKAPKTLVRDSGLCHALLGIDTMDALLSHPVVGASFEAFVIEQLLQHAPASAQYGYYRSAGGAEMDLVIEKGSERWAIEVKFSQTPTLGRGFYSACEDINPTRKIVIHQGTESFPYDREVEALTVRDAVMQVGRI